MTTLDEARQAWPLDGNLTHRRADWANRYGHTLLTRASVMESALKEVVISLDSNDPPLSVAELVELCREAIGDDHEHEIDDDRET